jgi:hypothetical protein
MLSTASAMLIIVDQARCSQDCCAIMSPAFLACIICIVATATAQQRQNVLGEPRHSGTLHWSADVCIFSIVNDTDHLVTATHPEFSKDPAMTLRTYTSSYIAGIDSQLVQRARTIMLTCPSLTHLPYDRSS